MECFTKRNVFSLFVVISLCGYILVITGVWDILDTPGALVYQDSTPTTVSETSSSSTNQLSDMATANTFNYKDSTPTTVSETSSSSTNQLSDMVTANTFNYKDSTPTTFSKTSSSSTNQLSDMVTVNTFNYKDSTPTTVSKTSSSSTNQLSDMATANTFNDKDSTSSSTSAAANNITGDETISPEYFADYVLPHNYTLHIRQNLSTKNILFHNKPFWLRPLVFSECEVSSCTLTTNRSLRSTVEAVVYHVDRLSDSDPPSPRPMGQIWVAYALESPVHYYSSFRSTAWRGVFNWTVTYRVDSDIFCPYHRLVFSPTVTAKNYTNIASAKSKSVAWFVSNCNAPSKRKQYVEAMQKENITIDIYGKCGSYNCSRSDEKTCENLLNSTYRFYLSFENSICRDYVTEKFFKTFGIDVVPVVRGGADYKKYFPRGTFVDTADFKSASELVKYLKYLERNLTAYAEILKKKDHYRPKRRNSWCNCKLCEMLHFVKSEKTYSDLPTWVDNQACRNATDI